VQAEAVAIEGECAFEVVDGERDDVEARLHRWSPPLHCFGLCARSSSSTAFIDRRSVIVDHVEVDDVY
jgi:hypothetical protein